MPANLRNLESRRESRFSDSLSPTRKDFGYVATKHTHRTDHRRVYPHDAIKQLTKPKPAKARLTRTSGKTANLQLNADKVRFDYVIKGDSPNWRPSRVFDDGKKVYIQFPRGLAVSEAPPLFITSKHGKKAKLVNYRVNGEYYVVDRLFDFAELRLGEKKQTVVRIERQS